MSDNVTNENHNGAGNTPDITPLSTAKRPLFHSLKVILSTLLLVAWCVLMLLIYFFWRLFRFRSIERCYFIFHTGCCWLFNLRCHVSGKISKHTPTLFLSNHVSYLDVFVLGKYVPAYFIAKSEVASWPVLGWLAKAQNTLFFERNSKRVRGQMQVMSDHFNSKGNLILFPEGTSTDGEHVKPFKSSLLQSVELSERDVTIQPVTLIYKKYDGDLMTRERRDQYAWYDTMPFAPHFFTALGLARADVALVFHPPVKLNDFANRKDCAAACQQQVAIALADHLSS
ncbi:lysophospholipid acyltransferase family protein [Eionea flava]